jgi:hypothetical protein
MAIYLAIQGALSAAIKIFLSGPGDHLQRFTGYPIRQQGGLLMMGVLLTVLIMRWLVGKYHWQRAFFGAVVLAAAATTALQVSDETVDSSIYWFAPSLFVVAILICYRASREGSDDNAVAETDRATLLILLLFSMAAYGEVFPRSVRGLVIEAMTPAFILLAFLCRAKPVLGGEGWTEASRMRAFWPAQRWVAFGVVSIVMLVFAARTVGPTYFSNRGGQGQRLRADSELNFDRGHGVYLPAKRARRVNAVVELIRSRVEPGGYLFAHSLDSTGYYFLADRKSPTAATLWNDTGTDDAERARLIGALREKQVRLVLTSNSALAAERYTPLLDMLSVDYHQINKFGQMIVLERNQ